MTSPGSWIKALALCALVGLLAGAPAVAQAQKKKDDGCLKDQVCKDRYNQALKLFDEGRFAEALPEFQAAYARRQMPWLLLNIGRTVMSDFSVAERRSGLVAGGSGND